MTSPQVALKNLPPLLSFLQLFLFSPVGYYFLTHFDNYFINQERLNKSLKIQLSEFAGANPSLVL